MLMLVPRLGMNTAGRLTSVDIRVYNICMKTNVIFTHSLDGVKNKSSGMLMHH